MSEDLAEHASFAHKLCKPAGQVPLNSANTLLLLEEQANKWRKVWKGGLVHAPALPALPTQEKPLPQDFLEQVFQDTSVEAYREACLAYPAKKAKGSDLWEARLIGALPDQVLFFMLV